MRAEMLIVQGFEGGRIPRCKPGSEGNGRDASAAARSVSCYVFLSSVKSTGQKVCSHKVTEAVRCDIYPALQCSTSNPSRSSVIISFEAENGRDRPRSKEDDSVDHSPSKLLKEK